MKIEKGPTGYLRMGLPKVRFLPIFLPKKQNHLSAGYVCHGNYVTKP